MSRAEQPPDISLAAAHDTKARIGQAAALLFQRQGYAGTGLKRIAAESGAAFGSIYHFFPGGKADLAEHAVRESGAAYRDLVYGVLSSVEQPEAALQHMFETAAAQVAESGYADACPIATVALEVASTDERLRRVTDEVFADWVDAGEAWFARWVEPPAARDLATSMVMLLEGAFLLARAARDPAPLLVAGRSMVGLFEAATASR